MTNQQTHVTLLVIKYLLDINNYNKYRYLLDNKSNSKEEKYLSDKLKELIGIVNRTITVDEYSLYILSSCTVKEKEVYASILDVLAKLEVKDDVVSVTLEEARLRREASEIASMAIDVTEGRKTFAELQSRISGAAQGAVEEDNSAVFITDDLEVLYHEQYQKQGLRWRLGTLNRMLGSLRQGDFGFIFARPETGKTTFLASEITNFACQVSEEHPILWFNNEEDGKKVKIRCYQAALGVTLPELFHDIRGNKQRYLDLVGNRIRIYDSASISRSEVEGVVDKLQPSCIIFDQIDKVSGFDSDRDDLRLGCLYIWARELAKTHCPVIGVTQADGSAEGKKWLTMDNVSLAKTSKQAEADWILGIGKVHDDGYEYVRYLHASKNKLQGDEDSDPAMRHGKQEVIIQPEIARYADYQR